MLSLAGRDWPGQLWQHKQAAQRRDFAMRRLPILMLFAAMSDLAAPVLAQEEAATAIAADPDTIQFDLGEVEEDDDDWGISAYVASQSAADRGACGTDSDLLAAQSTSSPRYDDNGALIREAPSAACVPPGSRYGALSQALRAEEQRRDQANDAGATAFLRQPDCQETATGYRCGATGTAGRSTYERQQQCEETGTTRTCSSSFSIGNSEEGRNSAQEAIDRLPDD